MHSRVFHSAQTPARTRLDEPFLNEIYTQLHRLARSFLRNERPNHTLQASALINEVYLRMAQRDGVPSVDRAHFLRLAARTMRQVLVDHSRTKSAQKRDSAAWNEPWSEAQTPFDMEQYLSIDQALTKLEGIDPRQAEIVELRFFGGLSIEETAEAMQLSAKTVTRDWTFARAWLRGELEAFDCP